MPPAASPAPPASSLHFPSNPLSYPRTGAEHRVDYKTISFVDRKFFAGREQQEKEKGSSELRASWKPPEGKNPIPRL